MRLVHAIAAASALFILIALFAVPASRSSVSGHVEVMAPSAPVVDSVHAAVESMLGLSGNLRALVGMPEALARNEAVEPLLQGLPIAAPGVHALAESAPNGHPLVVVSLESFPPQTPIRYRTGRWPTTGRARRDSAYAPPAGFIRVTPENAGTPVSERFALRDFLTHDQQNVWPKVLVLRPQLVDKLELIGEALDQRGLPSRLHVMSGFRTPQYNALEVRPGGRAAESRHMYGDAADVFVDADGNGRMDDLDHDGRVTVRDAQLLKDVAENVEASHPEVVGGLSAYPATSAHGPFVHVDTRGVAARW